MSMICTNTCANGRFFQKEGEVQFVNEFIGNLLQYVLDAESHEMIKERIMASNYYLMALMAEDIMADNSNRSPSRQQRPLDFVNFIAIKHNERRLRSLKLHTVTAQAGNVEDKNEEKLALLVPALSVIAITVVTAVHWNSAFYSYSVPMRVTNLSFAAICCICTYLRLQPNVLNVSPLILWLYSVDIYLLIYLFAEISIAFQVVGICFLVMEAVYLCILLKIVPTPIYAHSVLPYIKDIKKMEFSEIFESPEDMISCIEAVRSVMFDSLVEVETVLDSELFGRYIGINGIIAEYLKWTLPVFEEDDIDGGIEEKIEDLIRSHKNCKTVHIESCSVTLQLLQ